MPDTLRRLTATALIGLGATVLAAEGQLPLLRTPVLEPTLLPPKETVVDWAAWHEDASEWQAFPGGLTWRSEAPITQATFLAWTSLGGSEAYAPIHAFVAPNDAFGKAVGATFLGPESSEGSKTWPGVCVTAPAAGGAIALNLACSAPATLSAGRAAVTLAAGEHLGVSLPAAAGADLALTTSGSWSIEAATPKAVRCWLLSPTTGGLSDTGGANVLADQWGLSVVTLEVSGATLTRSTKTFYPDGCLVPESVAADTQTLGEGATAIPPATYSPFLLFFSSSIRVEPGQGPVSTYWAWGPKAFRRILPDAEIRHILARDAAEMVRRGYLDAADLHPEEDPHAAINATATLTIRAAPAKAAAKDHAHSPGLAPKYPSFHTQEETP